MSASKAEADKQLVMVDSAGRCVSLKLGNTAGLHFFDGTQLWVNPAGTVTAAAPATGPGAAAPRPPVELQNRPKNVLEICDPATGKAIEFPKPPPKPTPAPVVTTPSPAKTASPAAAPKPAAAPSPVVPLAPPPLPTPQATAPLLTGAPLLPPLLNPFLPAAPLLPGFPAPPLMPVAPPILPTPPKPSGGQNVVDLLSKATKLPQEELINRLAGQPGLPGPKGPAPTNDNRRDYNQAGRGRGRGGGRGRGQGAPQAAAKKSHPPSAYCTEGAKFSASLDGRFWCLSEWPTGQRDEEHNLRFGRHRMIVDDNGVVQIKLQGGINRYKVKLHLVEGDDLGANDKDGWMVASMGPSGSDLQLSPDAIELGWKISPATDERNARLLPPWVKEDDPAASAAEGSPKASEENKEKPSEAAKPAEPEKKVEEAKPKEPEPEKPKEAEKEAPPAPKVEEQKKVEAPSAPDGPAAAPPAPASPPAEEPKKEEKKSGWKFW